MPAIKIHPSFQLNGKKISNIGQLFTYIKEYLPAHQAFIHSLFDKHNFIIAKTSGSTGMPKQIKIKKQHLINSALKTIAFFELHPGTKALLNLSPAYIAGKMMWVRALIGGWHINITSPDRHSIAKQLAGQFYDFGAMVPMQAQDNIDLISNISKLIIGGGAVSSVFQKQLNELSNQVFGTYGMTETVTHIAVKPLNKTALKGFYTQKEQERSYQILQGITILKDERGCLVIEAPDLSDEKIVTNDLVEIVDNQHFKWLGRYDHIINSGGIKFVPEQIEDKLKKYIENEFFIAGLPDDKLGEKIVLFVEGKIEKQNLQGIFEQFLTRYEKPKAIIEKSQFVRTPTGKIQRLKTINSNIF